VRDARGTLLLPSVAATTANGHIKEVIFRQNAGVVAETQTYSGNYVWRDGGPYQMQVINGGFYRGPKENAAWGVPVGPCQVVVEFSAALGFTDWQLQLGAQEERDYIIYPLGASGQYNVLIVKAERAVRLGM